MSPTRLVLLSDTHGLHDRLRVPDGDVLVHAGDFTKRGREAEVAAFGAWLGEQPHAHKVVVAGNHDFLFEREPARARELLEGAIYLEHELAVLGDLRLFGSPWQPWFFDWAFNLRRGPELAAKWREVPSGVDVLVTHTPPMGVLDRTARGEQVGCADLAAELPRIAPKVHVFGHIHEARGTVATATGIAVNACNCNLRYEAVHAPIVVDITAGGAEVVST
ncbi:MAG: metallophosphatase domain-containing protein [Planctomycetota bacterium]